MRVKMQMMIVHRGDEPHEFDRKVQERINAGWQPEGPAGVMNMPRFDMYQTMRLYEEGPVPTPPEKSWKKIEENHVRMIYKCLICDTEYEIPAEECSVPYCTTEGCNENQTDFERIEVFT